MKTALLDGKVPPPYDGILFTALSLIPGTRSAVWAEGIRIGIRNKDGDVYRVIGVTGVTDFADAITKLHDLGYHFEPASEVDARQGFDLMLNAPRAG